MSRIKAWNLKQLKVVVKADSNWSLEALKVALAKLSTPETNVAVIHSWEPNTKARIIRKKSKIGEWEIISLKSWVEEVKEMEGPCECWIKFKGSIQPEMWDYLEIYKTIIEK